jgi:histidinol phosphatase-like enzyme
MAMKKTIICIDHDGTLVNDEKDHLFLGRDDDWKSKVELLPYAIDALKSLDTIRNLAIYMITNQLGIAISDYPLLTLERAHQVCTYLVDTLKSEGPY